MSDYKIGVVESRFADIVWNHAPLSTKELIELCNAELNWKRTTTYTVLKKLCERGIFSTDEGIVSVLINRDDFYAAKSEEFVEESFGGSLPAFIAAFMSNKKLSKKEADEIRKLIDAHRKEK